MNKSPFSLLCLLVTFCMCLSVGVACSQTSTQGQNKSQSDYQCLPCGRDCDKDNYSEEGMCSHCHMKLVKRSSVNFKTIAPTDICNYVNQHPGVVLLDVRTREEFEGKADPEFGTLKNAINIPVQELASRMSELSTYKNKSIIVYCSHSHRSSEASYLLSTNGFTAITNMSGGMSTMQDTTCQK